MKRVQRRFALVGLLVAAAAFAQPVPERVSFTGNLSQSGGPVSGMHNFIFTLYDAPTAGTVAWTEAQNNLPVTNGLVYASLGAVSSLNATVLNGAPLYLEVSVDGTTLSPRVAIQSVPYAIRAGTASSAATLGTLLPSDLQRRVNGACSGANAVQSIDADGGVTCVSIAGGTGDITSVNTAAGSGLRGGAATGDVNLALTTCANGESLKSNGTSWSCQPDPTITGTAPVAVTAGAVSLTTCGANQILKMNAGGTAWSCSTDLNNTYTGSGPIGVAGTTISLTACAANQVYKMNTAGTAWGCAPDNDTTYSGTAPIAVAGGAVSLTTCAANQVLKMNGAGTAWACLADNDTTYSAGSGLTLAGGVFATDNTVVARKDSAAGNQAFDTNTLFLDYTNNRVGVGITPAQTLDVNGTTLSTAFQYRTPRVDRYAVAGVNFIPDQGTVTVEYHSAGYLYFTGTTTAGQLYAPVNLPDGVTITGMTCYWYDSDTVANITSQTAYLFTRTPTDPTGASLASVSGPSGAFSSTLVQAFSTPALSHVVNTDNQYYMMYYQAVTAASSTIRFYGCRLAFTAPGPL